MGLSTFDVFKRLKISDAFELSDSDLRRLQNVLVGILSDVDIVCRDSGLTYMLGGGTALGACRHKGFIPWDDDIDLNIPRADYDRFIPLFRERFGSKYWIHTPNETPGYGLAFGRIRLKESSVKTREDFINAQPECGAFVDLFVIENSPSNCVLRALHGMGSLALGFLYSCRKFFHERRLVRRWMEEDAKMPGVFRLKCTIGFILAFASLDFWTHLWDGWNRLCSDGGSEYVTVPVGRRHYFGELTSRAGFCDTVDMEWEGLKVKVARDLDGYMRRLYGADYMTPPPPDKREKHILFEPFVLPPDLSRETMA